jgi:type IV secretion system protein VirD4
MGKRSLSYRPPRRGSENENVIAIAATFIIAFTAVLSLGIAMQRVAMLLGHSAILGTPLADLPYIGPLYRPWAVLVWAWQWRAVTAAEPIFASGIHIFEYPTLAVVGIAMVAVHSAKRTTAAIEDLHGSAHWGTKSEVKTTGLLNGDGVYIGAWHRRYLRDGGPAHVLAFAPSRTGKGVGLVIPTLLSWPDSVVVHDIKGENWKKTAGWRQRGLGNLCVRFDPTCSDGTAARFNPLAEIRIGAEEVKDAQNVADLLIDPAGNTPRDHWDMTAHDLLAGLILHVIYCRPNKTLAGCLNFLNSPNDSPEAALRAMIDTRHSRRLTHEVVAGAAQVVLDKAPNERASVISTATRCLSLYRDPIVAANTGESDFMIADLMRCDPVVSVYLTVPPSDLSRTRPLMRLVLAQMVTRLMERLDAKGEPRSERRLLLMLDEFPSLSRLDFLQTALSYAAGYGIKAFLIAQDLSQLYAAYGHDESIISNCGVRVAYTANKIETARLISDMLGRATVRHEHRTYSARGHTVSEPAIQRPLLTPDEAMRLPEEAALIFKAGDAPIYGAKIRYFLDPVFNARSLIPPPQHSDRVSHQHQWPPKAADDNDSAHERATPPPPAVAQNHVESREQSRTNADREWLFK